MQKDTPLTKTDLLMWNVDDPTGIVNITAIMFLKDNLFGNRVERILEGRIQPFEKFRQKVIYKNGQPTWHFDEHFDIHSHIHHRALPEPGDKHQLKLFVEDLISQPLDHTKPLWQIHIIENFEGSTAVVWRIHHSIGDGISLIKVLLSLTNSTAEKSLIEHTSYEVLTGHHEHEHEHHPNLRERVTHLFEQGQTYLKEAKELVIEHPDKLKEYVNEGIHSLKELMQVVTAKSHPDSIYKGELGVRKRIAWSETIPLETIKKIGKEYGGTVNDTLLVALSGAIRSHMLHYHQDLEMEYKIVCPVNMRHGEKGIHLGNKVGVIVLDLPINEVNPIKRFEIIIAKTKELKHSLEPFITFEFTQMISNLIPKKVEEVGAKFLGSKLMAVVSNVPGPRKAIYFAGTEVENIMFWLPQTVSLGVGMSIISYNNKVSFGVTTDAHLIHDPERIVEGFVRDIELMNMHLPPVS